MQKLILEAVEEFRKEFEHEFGAFAIMGSLGRLYNGAFANEARIRNAQDFITKVYKAGQKSREKEIVEKIKNSKTPEKLIKEQYECYDFDEAEVYALENEIIENIIKSLSLTKESK